LLELLEHIDHAAFSLINGFVGRAPAVDRIILFLRDSDISKGIPVMMIWWGLWFRDNAPLSTLARQRLLAVLLVSIAAIFAGRLLALTLPFRDRPIHSSEIDIALPANMSSSLLQGWSAFPSDHAVLFFALAAGIYLIHRWLGLLLFLHATIVVSIPRIYSGLHWPSDMLFGALIGISLTIVFVPYAARLFARHNTLMIERRYPFVLYPALFFITFQAASMFDSLRTALLFIFSGTRMILF
jgi:undecaprenyl-diphosphatase